MDSDFYSHDNGAESENGGFNLNNDGSENKNGNDGFFYGSDFNAEDEPQPERVSAQYQGNGYRTFSPEPPKPPVISKNKKNDGLKLKILIPVMCAACALIGGVCGGLTAVHFQSETTAPSQSQSTKLSSENESSKSIESLY